MKSLRSLSSHRDMQEYGVHCSSPATREIVASDYRLCTFGVLHTLSLTTYLMRLPMEEFFRYSGRPDAVVVNVEDKLDACGFKCRH